MKSFLIKIAVFGLVAFICHLVAGLFMNGNTDPYYLKFTPHANTGLVVGTSRASQGICPSDLKNHPGLFNAAFTLNTSPFGPRYNRYLDKMMNKVDRNQHFIVCVDPWSLSSVIDSLSGLEKWGEDQNFVAKTNSISNPNWEYLIEQYAFGWGHIIKERWHPTQPMTVHDDGWLEVHKTYDAQVAQRKVRGKMENYKREALPNRHPSQARLQALQTLIERMRPYGQVLLVRIPCDPLFREMEDQFWPTFNTVLEEVAVKNNVTYCHPDSLNTRLPFHDGNHLHHSGAHLFSAFLDTQLQ